MLRMRPYDLVVADVHMQGMNGFQLLRHIQKEFQLPVVLISADGNEEVVHKGMAEGAVSFLVKPFKSEDLRNLWQFSVWWRKFKNPAALKTGLITHEQYDNLMLADRPSHHGVPRQQNNNNDDDAAGHIATSSATIDVPDAPSASRTRKLVWTTTLHTRFVEALLIIGYRRAVPSRILKVMNVSELTREQVASHLQKYRNFMQRVVDKKTNIECSDWIDVNCYSSHVSGNPDRLLLEQLKDEAVKRDPENPIWQQDNSVAVTGAPSSSLLNPPASTTLTRSGFKILPPFTEAPTSGMKNTMNEMLIQETPMSTRGNTLVIGSSTTTNHGSSTNVATGDLSGSTIPYNNMGHVGSSSSVASVGQNLNCFDVPNSQMTYYSQTTVAPHYYFSGGFGKSNNVFTSINHVGPSSAPFGTSFYSQQSFNGNGQNSAGNNIQCFGDQQNYVEQLLNIGSPIGTNQFGVSSAMNEQVNDFGSIGFLPADNHLSSSIQNSNPSTNQERSEDNFWAEMMNIDCRGFIQRNNDGEDRANN